jgi:hypothetical protein
MTLSNIRNCKRNRNSLAYAINERLAPKRIALKDKNRNGATILLADATIVMNELLAPKRIALTNK